MVMNSMVPPGSGQRSTVKLGASPKVKVKAGSFSSPEPGCLRPPSSVAPGAYEPLLSTSGAFPPSPRGLRCVAPEWPRGLRPSPPLPPPARPPSCSMSASAFARTRSARATVSSRDSTMLSAYAGGIQVSRLRGGPRRVWSGPRRPLYAPGGGVGPDLGRDRDMVRMMMSVKPSP